MKVSSIKIIALFFVILTVFTSCQQITDIPVLEIDMHAIYEEPSAGVSGGFEPISQTYTIKAIYRTIEDGEEEDIYSGDAKLLKIIDREQLIFSKAIKSSEVGTKYSKLRVLIDPIVISNSRYTSDQHLTLNVESIEGDTGYTVGKGKSVRYTLKVLWKNTVTRDTSASPPVDSTENPELQLILTSH